MKNSKQILRETYNAGYKQAQIQAFVKGFIMAILVLNAIDLIRYFL